MKYTPVLVGAGVGILHSQVVITAAKSTSTSSLKTYAPGIVKFGVLGAALIAEIMGKGTPNINYGAASAASTLIGANLVNAVEDKSFKQVFTDIATETPTHAGHIAHAHSVKGTCSACAYTGTPSLPVARIQG